MDGGKRDEEKKEAVCGSRDGSGCDSSPDVGMRKEGDPGKSVFGYGRKYRKYTVGQLQSESYNGNV